MGSASWFSLGGLLCCIELPPKLSVQDGVLTNMSVGRVGVVGPAGGWPGISLHAASPHGELRLPHAMEVSCHGVWLSRE